MAMQWPWIHRDLSKTIQTIQSMGDLQDPIHGNQRFSVGEKLPLLMVTMCTYLFPTTINQWEFQDPIDWRYVNVPYVWPYFLGIFT